MNEDLYMIEMEQLNDEYWAGDIDRNEVITTLVNKFGFTKDEAEQEMEFLS